MVLTEEERRERHRLANKSYYQRQKEKIKKFNKSLAILFICGSI